MDLMNEVPDPPQAFRATNARSGDENAPNVELKLFRWYWFRSIARDHVPA
jgi:hypothetical protein